MIQDVDDFIKTRLEKVKIGGQTINIYPYVPEREKGLSVFPCYAFVRDRIEIREEDKRIDCELFIPGDEEVTVVVDDEVLTGVDAYTWKPYPSPIDVYYEVYCMATTRAHFTTLTELLIQTFPPGYIATINEQRVLFSHVWQKQQDDLDIPLYTGLTLLKASDIWVDRLEAEEYKSIQNVIFADDADDTAIVIG